MEERILTAADIDAASDVQIERVRTPEWGGVTLVRGMTGRERDAFEAEQIQRGQAARGDLQDFRARVLVRCICDEGGRRIYQDGDAGRLTARSARVLDRVYAVAARLSGLGSAEEKELLGESAGDPSSAAGSA